MAFGYFVHLHVCASNSPMLLSVLLLGNLTYMYSGVCYVLKILGYFKSCIIQDNLNDLTTVNSDTPIKVVGCHVLIVL